MANRKVYFTAQEVAAILGVSLGHSYKLIRKMNEELAEKGFNSVKQANQNKIRIHEYCWRIWINILN